MANLPTIPSSIFNLGKNNFNALYGSSNSRDNSTFQNRKFAAFFHDALVEHKVFKDNNRLKLGAGLTIVNGLSRFSQPSVSTIMTMDVPVFAQATVDQVDEFSRKLTLYARGQVGKIDYRIGLADPFPITSTGTKIPPLAQNASFATVGRKKIVEGYFMYQFLEHENHTTPGYMTGTYLGKKKVFNLAAGFIRQPKALWSAQPRVIDQSGTVVNDTLYHNMNLWSVESFLDLPLNEVKGTAISAYLGYFNLDYGRNYLRYNGIMNPGNGVYIDPKQLVEGNSWGNAYPMFGTGNVIYAQIGYLLPSKMLGEKLGQLMPYASWMSARYDRLQGQVMNVSNIGLNWLIKGHSSKLTLDYQRRPVYETQHNGLVHHTGTNSSWTLQYQAAF